MGNIVPAFEILFEDFSLVVGWFLLWVSIVTLHPAHFSGEQHSLFSCSCHFFFPNPFSVLLPSPDDPCAPCAVALRHPHGFLASLLLICEREAGQSILG